jgi:hypothetical protein
MKEEWDATLAKEAERIDKIKRKKIMVSPSIPLSISHTLHSSV